MDPDQEKKLKEMEMKAKMSKIARIKYMEEKELIQRKSYTSFGRLVLADEKTNPIFSFGSEKKFVDAGGKVIQSKTPGPIYDISDKFKYNKASTWKIGTGERSDLINGEKFDHYNHPYDRRYDYSTFEKQWQRTPGGAISLEPRIKYDFREGNPGPGRYEPEIQVIKKKAPAYFLGEKSNKDCLELLVGTNNLIGPGAYKPEESKKPSKHTDSPKWTIGKSKRKGLNLKVWTKNETYAVVSSVGEQAMSRKKTEPKIKMGKSTREKDKKLGMFPTMMSKQPTRVRIEHPKF